MIIEVEDDQPSSQIQEKGQPPRALPRRPEKADKEKCGLCDFVGENLEMAQHKKSVQNEENVRVMSVVLSKDMLVSTSFSYVTDRYYGISFRYCLSLSTSGGCISRLISSDTKAYCLLQSPSDAPLFKGVNVQFYVTE